MAEAWDIFADNYLKNLKRPEWFNFKPDDAFGANMLHGSSNINPWAGRDQSNEKYGMLGGTQPITQTGAETMPGASAPPQIPGQFSSPSQQAFANLMQGSVSNQLQGTGSKWLSNKLLDMFGSPIGKDATTRKVLEEAMQSSATGGLSPAVSPIAEAAASPVTGAVAEGAKTAMSSPFGFDPTTLALSAAPDLMQLMTGSKLAGKVATPVADAAMLYFNPVAGGFKSLMDIMKWIV
jgi:hypothetical protein